MGRKMPASFFRGFLQRYVRRLPSSFSMEIRGNLRCSFFKPARSCVSVGANAASEGKIRNECSACRQDRQAFFFGIRPRRRKGVNAPGGGRSLPDAAVSGGARRKTILAENRYAFQKDSNRKENLRRSFKATEGPVRKDRTGEIMPRVTACFQFPPIPPRALRKTYGKLPLFSIRG